MLQRAVQLAEERAKSLDSRQVGTIGRSSGT